MSSQRPPVALLAEGVDRNRFIRSRLARRSLSPSSRRAWIEIPPAAFSRRKATVALLAEGVDRNCATYGLTYRDVAVALLAEGVDRNERRARIGYTLESRPPRGGRG